MENVQRQPLPFALPAVVYVREFSRGGGGLKLFFHLVGWPLVLEFVAVFGRIRRCGVGRLFRASPSEGDEFARNMETV